MGLLRLSLMSVLEGVILFSEGPHWDFLVVPYFFLVISSVAPGIGIVGPIWSVVVGCGV